MEKLYQFEGLCLWDRGGGVPAGAAPCSAPFAPLVITVRRDPAKSRGLYRIDDLRRLDAQDVRAALQPLPPQQAADDLAALVQAEGACVLNTVFARCWDVLRATRRRRDGFRVHLVGLGDVGGTVLQGLVLLGRDLTGIGIYDPNEAQCRRYCLEMNQVLPEHAGGWVPPVETVPLARLFDCDALLFTASLGVPPVGAQVGDVRMIQYKRNRDMLQGYARMAREAGFTGLFAQISDPVDYLCQSVFLASNRDEDGRFDAAGLLPEQIQGYGLGVMRARAQYYAAQRGVDFSQGQVFGPHGQQLVVANAAGQGYDDARSRQLTQDTVTANLQVRALGYKPYIAPGLSSAAISVLRTLRGENHDGTLALGGAYFGCSLRSTRLGVEPVYQALHPALQARLAPVLQALREFDYDE